MNPGHGIVHLELGSRLQKALPTLPLDGIRPVYRVLQPDNRYLLGRTRLLFVQTWVAHDVLHSKMCWRDLCMYFVPILC